MVLSKYTSLIYMAVAIFCFSFWSCKTPADTKTGSKDSVKKGTTQTPGVVQLEGSGISQLYLMVRLAKQKGSDVPGIIGVERSISEKQGNPLPIPGGAIGQQAFKCEVIGIDGSIITQATQNASYEYGEKKNEAILKFILPVADEIKEARVSYQNKAGEWEVLLVEEMHDE